VKCEIRMLLLTLLLTSFCSCWLTSIHGSHFLDFYGGCGSTMVGHIVHLLHFYGHLLGHLLTFMVTFWVNFWGTDGCIGFHGR